MLTTVRGIPVIGGGWQQVVLLATDFYRVVRWDRVDECGDKDRPYLRRTTTPEYL